VIDRNEWYGREMAGEMSDSNSFPDFSLEPPSLGIVTPPVRSAHWMGAFMDCLFENRAYSLIKDRPAIFDPNEMLSTPQGIL
jgi:hypothetical protein